MSATIENRRDNGWHRLLNHAASPPPVTPRRSRRALAWTLGLGLALVGTLAFALLNAATSRAATDPLSWSPATLVDTGPHPINAILSISCPSTGLCVATDEDGNVLTSTDPTGDEEGDWSVPVSIDPGHPLEQVACPTTTFCVAVDGYGDAFSSTEPTGGASKWHEAKIDPSLSGEDPSSFATFVSCPTTKFCAVVTGSRELITSTEPLGGASKWTVSTNENMGAGYFSSLSCQSETLCVTDYSVAEDSSVIYSSTDPTGGWTQWSKTGSVSWFGGLVGPSCPTSSLCIGGSGSNIVTSSSPATGPWTESGPVENSWFNDISCASASLCVGVENGQGHLSVSTEPTGGASKWHVMVVGGYLDSLSSVSCVPNTTTCVATDYEGNVISSTSPTTSWDSTHVDNSTVTKPDSIESLSCASASLCLAGDAYGRVLYSTNPKAGASSWSAPVTASAGSIEALDCIPGLCVGAGGHGYYDQIVASMDPTGGEETWGVVDQEYGGWTAVSCASTKLCVAVANGGEIASSATPTAFGSWTTKNVVPDSDFTGVSCPSEALCVATNERAIYTNKTPTNPATWTAATLVPEGQGWLNDVSCPSTTRCFASDESGNIWTSINPTGGVAAWTKIKASEHSFAHVSCPTTSFCLGMEQNGSVFVSQEPSVEGSWNETKLTEGFFKDNTLQDVTCANEELCLATDEAGEIATGTQTLPAGVPAVTELPTISGSAQEGRVLSASPGAWTNSPSGYSYQWERCNAAGVSCRAIAEATTTTYDVTSADVGATMRVSVTASNSHGVGETGTSAATGVVAAAEAGKHEEQIGGGGGGGSSTTARTAQVTPAESTPVPVVGQRQTVSPVSGTVLVRLNGSSRFVALSAASSIPDGSEVDATNGRVIITVATSTGTVSAEAYGGRFVIEQEHTGSDEARFVLSLPLTGCPRVALPHGSAAAVAKSKHGPKSRHLWVSEHGGSWGTNGRYVSTSVEGTHWLTLDECNQSRVTVVAGKVKVHNLISNKTKTLTAGESYVAARR